MSTTNGLLDRAKAALGVDSDYALAKALGITQPAVTAYRHGKSAPEPAIAGRLAEIIGQPPLQVIAMIEQEREAAKKHPRAPILEFWNRYCPRLLPTIAAAVIVGGSFQTRSATPLMDDLYIMRTRRRSYVPRFAA